MKIRKLVYIALIFGRLPDIQFQLKTERMEIKIQKRSIKYEHVVNLGSSNLKSILVLQPKHQKIQGTRK